MLDVRIERGVKVNNAEPDGLIERAGDRFYLEADVSGKMNARQMKSKWERYGKVEGFILVVARTESRMQRLMKGAELVKTIALFSTFERVKQGKPWVDWYGRTVDF